jgi:hypothetical protein
LRRLDEGEIDCLLAAAADVPFGQFWADLLAVVHYLHVSPIDVLVSKKPLAVPPALQEAAGRLRTEEWPFALRKSKWGSDGFLRGLRAIAERAGVDGWKKITFDAV